MNKADETEAETLKDFNIEKLKQVQHMKDNICQE